MAGHEFSGPATAARHAGTVGSPRSGGATSGSPSRHGHGHVVGTAGPLTAPHQHQTGRVAHLAVEQGRVESYDAPSNRAVVVLQGTLDRNVGPIPVSAGLPTGSLVGMNCLVVFLDAHNPGDAALVAAWS